MIRRYESAHAHTAKTERSSHSTMRLLAKPYSDSDIILMHHASLTSGIHHFKAENIAAGRVLIETILDSLNCYHNIACFTATMDILLPGQAINIAHRVNADKMAYNESLEELLLECLACDFLWVENTEKLSALPLFLVFEQLIQTLHLNQSIPIIELHYVNEATE